MLSPEVLAEFRRRHFAEAMAELCAEQGYRATTITHLVARAKTSRNTVYRHFGSREEVFLELLQRASADLFARTEAACQAADAERQLEAGLSAILTWVAEEPAAAWALLVEATRATPESFRRYFEMMTKFATLLRGNVPTEIPRPATTEESLVGGVTSILRFRLLNGEAQRAPELLAELTTFLRTPFLATSSVAAR
jgi:AcrR family transcriptional regulator